MCIGTSLNVWKIAPGERAELWDDCYKRGYICIGNYPRDVIKGHTAPIGNLLQYERAQLDAKFKQKSPIPGMLWAFSREIEVGDIIIANKGQSKVCGIGIVTSDYIPPDDPNSPRYNLDYNYENIRFVKWFRSLKIIDLVPSMK